MHQSSVRLMAVRKRLGAAECAGRMDAGALAALARMQQRPPSPAMTSPERPLPGWRGVRLQRDRWRSNPFNPSYWSEPKLGGYDWRLANAVIKDDALVLTVSEKGSGQVQSWGRSFSRNGLWEVDVTLPLMSPGLVAAPLWTFNGRAKEEIDFEVVGVKGLFVTVFANVDGRHTKVWTNHDRALIGGDLSGRRLRLGLAYRAGEAIEFWVNGRRAARLLKDELPSGRFPDGPQAALFDFWVAAGLHPGWAGRWLPMATNERRDLIIHGYKQGQW